MHHRLKRVNVLIGGVRSSGLCTRPQIEQTGSTCGLVSLHQRSVMATSKFTFIELTYSWIHLIQTWLFQIPHVFKLNSITLALSLQTFKIGYFKLLLFPTFFCFLWELKIVGFNCRDVCWASRASPCNWTENKRQPDKLLYSNAGFNFFINYCWT